MNNELRSVPGWSCDDHWNEGEAQSEVCYQCEVERLKAERDAWQAERNSAYDKLQWARDIRQPPFITREEYQAKEAEVERLRTAVLLTRRRIDELTTTKLVGNLTTAGKASHEIQIASLRWVLRQLGETVGEGHQLELPTLGAEGGENEQD